MQLRNYFDFSDLSLFATPLFDLSLFAPCPSSPHSSLFAPFSNSIAGVWLWCTRVTAEARLVNGSEDEEEFEFEGD
jgi:hypothetical protein